ncbi:MAG: di-heme oxidoredictase family protein, partial [Polyangiales bacterium]
PLVGLRFARRLMHDGRAEVVDAAVRAHRGDGSEANGSVDAFEALSAGERAALVEFVGRL